VFVQCFLCCWLPPLSLSRRHVAGEDVTGLLLCYWDRCGRPDANKVGEFCWCKIFLAISEGIDVVVVLPFDGDIIDRYMVGLDG
jgi:hypothetical protein